MTRGEARILAGRRSVEDTPVAATQVSSACLLNATLCSLRLFHGGRRLTLLHYYFSTVGRMNNDKNSEVLSWATLRDRFDL